MSFLERFGNHFRESSKPASDVGDITKHVTSSIPIQGEISFDDLLKKDNESIEILFMALKGIKWMVDGNIWTKVHHLMLPIINLKNQNNKGLSSQLPLPAVALKVDILKQAAAIAITLMDDLVNNEKSLTEEEVINILNKLSALIGAR